MPQKSDSDGILRPSRNGIRHDNSESITFCQVAFWRLLKPTRFIDSPTDSFGLLGGKVDPINGDGSGKIIEENKRFRHRLYKSAANPS